MACLALVAAMHEELAAVLEMMPDERKQTHAGREFWCGHWHGHEVVVVLSRIGKVAAATTAAALIEHFGVTRMVFTGVAGGLGPGVKVGDLVVARELLQHDMDASPLFPVHEIPLTGRSRFATDQTMSDALVQASREVLSKMPGALSSNQSLGIDFAKAQVHEGLIISGDQFVSQTAQSQRLLTALPDALAVEMECAAMAQVCSDYGVPLAAVRSISDRADDAASVDFPKYIQHIASRVSAAILDELLMTLERHLA
jgi:adenosylhomocysteine nucleosidase